ncbi:GLPGLI family protein [Cellulophaga sp. F20128]|uniref:GLPGLI family protein n=1 Tax=Cellulophaga sp. F20128 TaxID=2926413 RepID=UPI001FF219B2|nr:GLPGLI family protein [Cellulophaga sp. F20128]MCK0156013.1 GLPGLI family protein [Cellulophaga sp. F20128]
MKNIFLTAFAVLCFTLNGNAQDFQGKAIYEIRMTQAPDFGGRDLSDAQKKEFTERMKSGIEKSYTLSFDRTSSYYEENEKLEAPGGGGGGRGFRFGGGEEAGKLYKNIKDKKYVKQIEMYSKLFLIEDDLKTPEWKMGAETKKIGNYTAYKATLTTAIDTTGAGEMARIFSRNRNGQGSTPREIPTEKTVTAWYTLDIPVSLGPAEYWGLPGLILEIEQDRSILVCSKIVMNATDIVEVEAPSKGKSINQEDFDELMAKKRMEMMQNFQGRGGRGGGGRR